MSLSNKPLESITESDLQSLVDNQRVENKTVEYKESLPGNSDADKRDFLAGVSAFANAAGGNIIYGIKEIEGVPSELNGLELTNVDAEKLRLENIIRNGIDPRIPSVSIREIPIQTSRVAIVIRIPRSWASPHMVTFKGPSKFYSRNSAGKFPLDVSEIRALFALSETTSERIQNFRLERLQKIMSEEMPVALERAPKIVLHIIPFGAFDPVAKFDVSTLIDDLNSIRPVSDSRTLWYRYNFDGLLTYCKFSSRPVAHTYLQIFRNGAIEAVEADLLRNEDREIPSVQYEKELLEKLPRFLAVQKKLSVEPPLFVMLTLLNVTGYTMAVDRRLSWHRDTYPIDRDTLLVPEIMIETFECNPADVMKPIFDAVWNAAGWPRSMNYNDNGEWVVQ